MKNKDKPEANEEANVETPHIQKTKIIMAKQEELECHLKTN